MAGPRSDPAQLRVKPRPAQRAAHRVRGGRASADALRAWDLELGRLGSSCRANRARAVDLIAEPFAEHAEALGLEARSACAYRPRSRAASAEELAEEIAAALDHDLARGYTTFGPHRDELVFRRAGRDLRAYGSQGEQRVALLALLLAERDTLAEQRDRPPLLLLDDVMSELDARAASICRPHRCAGAGGGERYRVGACPGATEAGVADIDVGELIAQEA